MAAPPEWSAPRGGGHFLRVLYRRTYGLRMLGMGLGSLPVGVVLYQLRASWGAWAYAALVCFAWPHVAYLAARRSADPAAAERRNLLADSLLAGTCAPLMHFNLLPSVVLIAVVGADKVTTGIRGLWLRSLGWTIAGIGGGGLATGFATRWTSDMPVVVASLPILVIHTLVVSMISYGLVRRLQKQNRQLQELAHTDPLTGLLTRRRWEQDIGHLLSGARAQDDAVLALIDLDAFKEINDTHGHLAGDDVLRGIGGVIRKHAVVGSLAGRIGGDEIAVMLPVDIVQAAVIAERIRAEVETLQFAQAPALRCTVSIGMAPRPPGITDSRDWLEAADRALYRAKHDGRNRIDHTRDHRPD